ncbi:MAG: hypothetical protein U1E94_07565 [Agitococcus sp.]
MIDQSGAREIPDLAFSTVYGGGLRKGWDVCELSRHICRYGATDAGFNRWPLCFSTEFSLVDWIGLPLELDDIDRIEVIRAINAAAYGANSFLAVVNIITRNPADLPKVRAYTRQGGQGINDTYVTPQVCVINCWRLTANSRTDSGFDKYFNKENLRDTNGNKVFDSKGDAIKVFNPYPYADDKRQKVYLWSIIRRWQSK